MSNHNNNVSSLPERYAAYRRQAYIDALLAGTHNLAAGFCVNGKIQETFALLALRWLQSSIHKVPYTIDHMGQYNRVLDSKKGMERHRSVDSPKL
ncbi:hypothetical protein [Desulfogranum marinum]|jgi:hypothetical protein|uniref:hypothetical protein n=1 Tax=Desulfogranum marinum TaxID=453220 RepID=UPI001964B991|nr:hypothetical protein [Desulfogranum marinum]